MPERNALFQLGPPPALDRLEVINVEHSYAVILASFLLSLLSPDYGVMIYNPQSGFLQPLVSYCLCLF